MLKKISYGIPLYLHKVNLISLAKDLVYKTLENMTLTQPKGDFGQYSHMVSKLPLDTTLRSLQVGVKSTYDFPCYED